MRNLGGFFFLSLVLSASAIADPAVQFSGGRCRQDGRENTLRTTTAASCTCLNRALDAVSNHLAAVKQEFKPGISINFNVLYQNPNFYLTHLRNRVNSCNSGKMTYKCVGLCNTPQGTLAYVNVYFGHAASTVNVCDELFKTSESNQQDTITHEMGRVENIGDSPNFDTNNIYVWDAIVQRLCDEGVYRRVTGT